MTAVVEHQAAEPRPPEAPRPTDLFAAQRQRRAEVGRPLVPQRRPKRRIQSRRQAPVIDSRTTDGHTQAIAVRCPYCRGTHWHAFREVKYAHPWCGTPAAGYELVWREDLEQLDRERQAAADRIIAAAERLGTAKTTTERTPA